MSITIRNNQPQEVRASLEDYLYQVVEGNHCLIESIGYIVTRQEDDSLCAIALLDEITFTVYVTGRKLLEDLQLDVVEQVILLDSIDITYCKELK